MLNQMEIQQPQPQDQPEWYLLLDEQTRQVIDQILIEIDRRLPKIPFGVRTSIFWRVLDKLGITP